jgi:hypothetical protein
MSEGLFDEYIDSISSPESLAEAEWDNIDRELAAITSNYDEVDSFLWDSFDIARQISTHYLPPAVNPLQTQYDLAVQYNQQVTEIIQSDLTEAEIVSRLSELTNGISTNYLGTFADLLSFGTLGTKVRLSKAVTKLDKLLAALRVLENSFKALVNSNKYSAEFVRQATPLISSIRRNRTNIHFSTAGIDLLQTSFLTPELDIEFAI